MNKSRKSQIGQIGEDVASKYLICKGYEIIERNFRKTWGEIDIVAMDKGKILVFVEVKTIAGSNTDILPEDNMTRQKIKKLKKICDFYANKNEHLVRDNGWRIDLLSIQTDNLGNYINIRHYQNVIG